MKKYETLTASTGAPLPDPITLEIFKTRVGPTSKLLIQRLEEENPHRPFAEYYDELARVHVKDATDQARMQWNRLVLRCGSTRFLTMEVFRKYVAEFKVLRNRVGNTTETEAYGLLFAQLPEQCVLKVKEEEARRSKHKTWVKCSNVPDISSGE